MFDEGVSAKRLEFFELSPLPYQSLDQEGYIIYVNNEWLNLLGYNKEEVLGKWFGDFIDPKYLEDFRKNFPFFKQIGEIKKVEYELLKKDGSPIYTLINGKVSYDEQGNFKQTHCIVEDITDLKLSEEELKKSKELQEVILSTTDFLIAYMDSDFNFIQVNQAYADAGRRNREGFIGKNHFDLYPHEENEQIFRSVIETGEPFFVRAKPFEHPDQPERGTTYWDWSLKPVRDSFGNIDGVVLSIYDVTEREKAKESLRQYRRAVEGSKDLMNAIDKNYRYLFANQTYLQYHQIDEDQLVGKTVEEIMGEETFKQSIKPMIDRCLRGETIRYEMTREYPELGERHLDIYYYPLKNEDEEIIGLAGVLRDITERKQIEKELEEHRKNLENLVEERTEELRKINEQLLREIEDRKNAEERIRHLHHKNDLILNSVAVGIYEINLEGDITFVNNAAVKVTGYSYEEIMGRNHHTILHHTKSDGSPYPLEECPVHKTLKDGVNRYITEEVFWKKDGNSFPVQYVVTPVEENNEVTGAVVVFRDLTNVKQKEEEIRRLTTAVEHTKDSIIITDRGGTVVDVNDSAMDLFGVNPKGKKFSDLVDPKDHRKVEVAFSNLKDGDNLKEEYYISREDNIAIESNMSPITYGESVGYVIISRDISERKKAEDDLKKKLIRFNLEERFVYLEENFDKSLECFKELHNAGYNGLVISRTPKEKLDINENDCDFWWISHKGDGISDLNELEDKIEERPKKNAILIDRLDYLISRNGFDETLSFVYDLREIAYLKDSVVILVLDPLTVDEKQLALIKKETSAIEPRSMEKIPDDLLSILKFVYSQNRLGIKPCYTEICKELNVSKPTLRKKLKDLVNKDYLNEDYDGRHKRVEITEKTRYLFSS